MKALEWNGHDGSYRVDETGLTHPIRDITEDDVLSLMRLILRGEEEIEFDTPPEDSTGADPAAFVIYEELYRQFKEIVARRSQIISSVDSKFDFARKYYSDGNIAGLFS